MQDRKQRIEQFVQWARRHVTGDEKGEAQIFLDRLFQAFGQKGSLDVGGTPEIRIRRAARQSARKRATRSASRRGSFV